MKGYIHSLQSMGAVDGPGLRFVVFMQGCPLRCMYCHNPDTWTIVRPQELPEKDGAERETCEGRENRTYTAYTADELVKKILRYKTYFTGGGGVTVSGGEPLVQAEFVAELFEKLHAEGINTCLDTSGNYPGEIIDFSEDEDMREYSCNTDNVIGCRIERRRNILRLLDASDLVICDIKFTTEETYRKYTGGSLKKTEGFMDAVNEKNIPMWVRHVVVPDFTDSQEEVDEMAAIARKRKNVKKIELLPFHKLCVPKYEALGIPFACADIPECSREKIEKLRC